MVDCTDPEVENSLFSLQAVLNGEEYQGVKFNDKDEKFLFKFDGSIYDYIYDDCEVIVFDGLEVNTLDAETELRSDFKFKVPDQKTLDRLKKLMKYKKITVKQGVFLRD